MSYDVFKFGAISLDLNIHSRTFRLQQHCHEAQVGGD